MKITFEFDTEDENFDRVELYAVENAMSMAAALAEINEKTRSWSKYGSFPKMKEQNPIDYVPGSEEYCQEINEFIKKHDIPDMYAIEDEIRDIINSHVDMGKLGW